MSDYFIHNSEMFMPKYNPGINAYGQKGSAGNTGESGSSVYYSAIEVRNNKPTVIELIKRNKMLSNNIFQDCYNTYKSGDTIIDCVGNLYTLTIDKDKYTLESSAGGAASIYSSATQLVDNLAVYCSTSTLIQATQKWLRSNPYYIGEINDGTGTQENMFKTARKYRDIYDKEISGNYVSFTLVPHQNVDISKYDIKFALSLPNGQIFEKEAGIGITSATLFVDNRFLYGCFDHYDNDSIANIHQNAEDTILTGGVPFVLEGNLSDYINGIIEGGSEYSNEVSMLCSYFIKRNCKAYAEMTSIETGKTYRFFVDDIYVNEENEKLGPDDRNDFINKFEPSIIWNHKVSYEKDKWICEYLNEDGNPVLTSDRSEAFRPFDQYVFFDDQISSEEEEKEAADNTIINLFYASLNEKQGFDGYLRDKTFYTDLADTPTGKYWAAADTAKSNRVYRLHFKNISELTLKLQFSQISDKFPTCLVYVGVPDCNLVQYGDADKEVDGKLVGVEPGIYYAYKIVPPNVYDPYEDDDDIIDVPDAGLVTFNANLSKYSLDPTSYHFIDIGITDYGYYNGATPNVHTAVLEPDDHVDPESGEPDVYTYNAASGEFEVKLFISHATELTASDVIENVYSPLDFARVDKPTKMRIS